MAPLSERLSDEAVEVIADAERAGVAARLLGGIGIQLLLGDRLDPAFARAPNDIDLICEAGAGSAVERIVAERGWSPAEHFNKLNGARRLLFHDPQGPAQVDVFVGRFEMCHSLPLSEGLGAPAPSLPATHLLLTKLQIVEMNAKDRGDALALLAGGLDGPVAVDPASIARITADDWGLHHTVELNVAGLSHDAPRGTPAADALVAIRDEMERSPKSRGWRMRARVGERKRWYDLPEEVDR